jgi:lipoate-protein ligase A
MRPRLSSFSLVRVQFQVWRPDARLTERDRESFYGFTSKPAGSTLVGLFMNCLDLTLPTPAENLACDEALLEAAEAGEGGEALRFWEPRQHFVVVGYANKVDTEVNVPACESCGVPILRRCSGGGTVLQGAGCLNYALILKIGGGAPLHNISAANEFIMKRIRAAIQSMLGRAENSPSVNLLAAHHPLTLPSPPPGERVAEGRVRGVPENSKVKIQGHTDLTLNGLKFSGNSQRRRRHFLLFHGTFLLDLDLGLIERLLPPPSKQPDYRRHRTHADFLVNLQRPAATVKAALSDAWRATASLTNFPRQQIETLVHEKYSTLTWTMKF